MQKGYPLTSFQTRVSVVIFLALPIMAKVTSRKSPQRNSFGGPYFFATMRVIIPPIVFSICVT